MFWAMMLRACPARDDRSSPWQRRAHRGAHIRWQIGRGARDEFDHTREEGGQHPSSIIERNGPRLGTPCTANAGRGRPPPAHMDFRIEHDSLGDVRVPATAYYGAQTQRAVENFPISGLTAQPELVTATVLIKKAAADANAALGRLDREIARAIVAAADEILDGPPARSVRRRRVSGRRRNVAQHEHERSAGEPRRRDPRRAAGHVHAGASERPRQHGTVDQRRVSNGHADSRCSRWFRISSSQAGSWPAVLRRRAVNSAPF